MTQADALAIMKTGVNVYLTGSAGSGKTYLLNEYIRYLYAHDIPVAVTASTGIAATHMNGMTIHGWAGIGIKESLDERDLDALEEKSYLWKRFELARVLVIDEVSMLHAHRLDMVERVCRHFKRNDKPFGGLQVILSGDFFQLPPVTRGGQLNLKDMIIYSKAWENMNATICYLTEQHRQEDQEFTNILNAIRDNALTDKHLDAITSRMNATLKNVTRPTKLYTHNANVDTENYTELGNINSEERVYKMTSSGRDVIIEILKKSCLASEELRLKAGAEVMFIKNNFEEGYVNGTRGTVQGFDTAGAPVVKLQNGNTVHVESEMWAIEEDGKIKASLTQLPLRLAWAITIHKSQGMSLDSAEIDLANTFAYGMGYVALSRVRTLAGIRLVGFHPDSLKVDPVVLAFDNKLKKESINNEQEFKKHSKATQEKLEKEFIIRMGGTLIANTNTRKRGEKKIKVPTILLTKELLDQGKSIKEIAEARGYTVGTIIGHVTDIMEKYPETIIKHIRPSDKDIEAVKKVSVKLPEEQAGKLTPIKFALEKTGNKMSFEEIRLALLFI